ncbi:putative AUT2/APG4/ATG4 cysteine peptidase putativecysteine peptidase Clan CA family C54 [Leptomonas pyrrhocoris]|uniref:Cysteine protease n=1 Tax=Leptomonas pyrrhocoris TaxID=157538 RepID=A0A0M9G645_LEPPY|nr:putative AUT2/APG4/ATG4 cysteine peptidase putativecysteine peptidase Clan CA family C54 [Leptomonas pyrrhocoris]KPA82999.1 putative AUT2/APG4/ATG4 cysteine peptidase putativecysteine peptidase Clan CA family C54 [Leptomonas pyrrhocoris]|eukprot:XP_015661438.1 putative AUT2/APG4/ATG4 cysteine peptidase putativecysteine peptidase Clan CA family C54 [Leptomonas pyrrhocoris]
MLRYMQGMWDSFFPTEPVFPLQIVGSSDAAVVECMEDLEKALQNQFYLFTYREGFEPIAAVTRSVETDQGWGCLLRTTQMLLAHFLAVYGHPADRKLSLFFDHSGESAPFSIHNMIRRVWNRRAFKPEYWSPSQGCEAVKQTMHDAMQTHQLETRVSVVTSSNGCIYSDEVRRAFKEGAAVVLVLAAVRVSAAPFLTQESYLQIEKLMEQPQCLGVVGGIPGRSYYFFAHNQTQVLYFDPHQHTHLALTNNSSAAMSTVTPSLQDVRCVHWSRVDTSLFVAFAVRSREEWARLESQIPTKFLHVEAQRTRRDFEQLVRTRQERRTFGEATFISPLQTTCDGSGPSTNCAPGGVPLSSTAPPAKRRTLRIEKSQDGRGGAAAGGGNDEKENSANSESWEYLD